MFRYWMRGPLREVAGADGGGAGGAGSGTPGAQSGVTIEVVNKTINDALARMRKTDIPKAIEEALKPLTEGVGSLQESLKPLLESQGKGGGAPEGGGAGGEGGSKSLDPQVAAKLKDQEKTIGTLQKAVEELTRKNQDSERKADEADRNSQLTGALSGYSWLDDAARAFAFDSFAPRVKRTEDGTLVIGELPLKKAIEDQMGTRALQGLLAPKQGAGGAGAGNSGGSPAAGGSSITLDSIKPGMTKEQTEATLAELRKHIQR